MPDDIQRAAIERLRKFVSDQSFIYDQWRYDCDMCIVRDLYLADHPADGPSAADELREARRLLDDCEPYVPNFGTAGRVLGRIREFLTRTSRFE